MKTSRAESRFARRSEDDGFTLSELLVVMVIMGVVGTLCVVAITQVTVVFVRTEEEGDGLGQAKTVMDRVTRDVREARAVVCDGVTPDGESDPYCARHLELWIDEDGDYLGPPHNEDASETVTWSVEGAGDGVYCDVIRTQNGGSTTVARSLVIDETGVCQTFFTYDPAVPPANASDATMVTMTMQYDPKSGTGVEQRTASTSVQLRNAEL